jgi:integrase
LPLAGSFEEVARAWFETRRGEWAPSYANKVIRRLEAEVFPHVGRRSIADVSPPELLAMLRKLEARGVVETAHRVRETCSLVFRFAVAEGRIASDPARDLAGALKNHQTRHIPAITDPVRFGELLRAIDTYRGTAVVRAALKLAALVFLRPGAELRAAQWSEFDLEAGLWRVPAERMKRRKHGKENGPDHLVPLSRQAVVRISANVTAHFGAS